LPDGIKAAFPTQLYQPVILAWCGLQTHLAQESNIRRGCGEIL